MNLRIMTYNIQHGRVYQSTKPTEEIDLHGVGDVIRETGADIIGLNEVRGNGPHPDYTAQAEWLGAYLGMHVYFGRSIRIAGAGAYGNAVLSRWPLLEAKVIPIPDPADPTIERFHCESRAIVRVVAEVPDGDTYRPLAVYSTHFGLHPDEAEHAASTVWTVLREETLPFVLLGDFNLTPDSPLLLPLYRNLHATDAWIPEENRRTFPSDAPVQKIDYIFTSDGVYTERADTVPATASDHRPVWADIQFS